ncbi:PD-(D/E)XK nuclease family protein [Chitinilyticum piscinae]|uniref:PD-(D/E)XK nuclease family protein n=1 Tax=Chitinilyticum piscinae TaxID=2866724 RepID=A0A8J7FMG2_9NEIS|nr:PD-(D/E)XK nuclease family protein [Chitinilyticum piscinae]MBE9610847.1 PD-(D/E)XK nuclease family protein [Chitinilyticum piscinae]
MTGLHITFGLYLDGQRTEKARNALGHAAVGPMGLLQILEDQLGLTAILPAHAERVIQYRDCLRRCDRADRFFHQSFATDPLGTAATLLEWRDQWSLHGWNGQVAADAPLRLVDMADVEVLAAVSVSPNVGQRLRRVSEQLTVRQARIDSLRCIDPLATLPLTWQTVLAKLPVKVEQNLQGAGHGFLGELQQQLKLAKSGLKGNVLKWRDDGSVLVVQSETECIAASWLSVHLPDEAETLLVAGEAGAVLDGYLASANQARLGLKASSSCRPALQVLPMALALLWDPLDYGALLQFLTHPICPIRSMARRKLAEKIADAPGVGGERWQNVLNEIAEYYGPEQAEAVRAQITSWVEHRRFPLEEGVPVEVVLERVRNLQRFFRHRLGDEDVAAQLAFQAGYAQCSAFCEALDELLRQGEFSLRQRQLQKLVMQVVGAGALNPLGDAEVGACLVTRYPGAVFEQSRRVIWWQMGMPVLPSNLPWSNQEVQSLAHAGCQLPAVGDQLDQAAVEWIRPVMAATDQLVLVLPPPGREVHPLWQMICSLVDEPVIQPLERLIEQGGQGMVPLKNIRLPSRKRWWSLPEDVSVELRAKESFSSLESMLFNPYQWLLKYPADLRPSRSITQGHSFRMLGNLAHALVERYYRRSDALQMDDAQFAQWFDEEFRTLIMQEGATLLAPGKRAELETFRRRLENAMVSLRKLVESSGIVDVIPEQPLSGTFPGGALAGYADLVMTNQQGARAVVDMKWAGATKYRGKLKANQHLQLAVYAELLRQDTKAAPSVAYFILDRALCLAADDHVLQGADVVNSADGEDTAQLWRRFINTWRWRAKQIQEGLFEVAMDGTEPDEDSTPPDNGLAMEYLNEAYNDYRTLAGWSN